jgi:hypothetical protein
VVNMKIMIFWVVLPCSLVGTNVFGELLPKSLAQHWCLSNCMAHHKREWGWIF